MNSRSIGQAQKHLSVLHWNRQPKQAALRPTPYRRRLPAALSLVRKVQMQGPGSPGQRDRVPRQIRSTKSEIRNKSKGTKDRNSKQV
jgi:hypothetical protein